jgi:hypothetical protein
MDVTAARSLSTLYVYLDCTWLVIYAAILLWRRKYRACLVGLLGGLLYFLVDYGIFFSVLHTRVVTGANPFWFLLWLSLSYGFTNMAWVWLLLDTDGHRIEWSLLTVSGWLAVAFMATSYGTAFPMIHIQRGTQAYHGAMALILAVGYSVLILRNLSATQPRVNLLRLLAIGVGVQASWELVLLLTGVRPPGAAPLIVNSLLETNLGMPYLFLIHEAMQRGSTQRSKARRS